MIFCKKIKPAAMQECAKPNYLIEARCQDFFYELKKILSVTENLFEQYYIPVIESISHLLQTLPDKYHPERNHPYGLLQNTCERTLHALKQRRHRFLPTGGDAETGYSQSDYWTYAVFICAMTRDLWKCNEFNLCIATENSTSQGFEPISDINQQPYISTILKPYSLSNHSNITLALARIPKTGIVFLKHIPLVWEHVILYWHDQYSMITPLIRTEKAILQNVVESTPEPAELSFTDELDHAINSGAILFNTEDSTLHGVAEGVLLLMPDFLTTWQKISTKIINEKSLLTILNDEHLLLKNTASNTPWHTYYQGYGFKKIVLEGFLLDKTKLTTIPLNDTLYRATEEVLL